MMLGAVLAGGRSTRFGSDKALAVLDGRTLLDRAIERLDGWCDAVVVVGHPVASAIPDWPRAGLGPLGGIAAALRHAAASGFGSVLTVGVDSVGLPEDLPGRLTPAPACLASQPVVGLWPRGSVGEVEAILAGSGSHSMFALAERLGARMIELPRPPANINTPGDLAAFDR